MTGKHNITGIIQLPDEDPFFSVFEAIVLAK
jgi:hypothetical protein